MSLPEALPAVVGASASAPAEDKRFRVKKGLALRVLITVIALAVWFWTQSLLGARSSPTEPIGDGLHKLTAGLNAFFQSAPRGANALLIFSSALIDAMGIFLLGSWIFAGKLRPFLGLAILLVTRQVMQALCSLTTVRNYLALSRVSFAPRYLWRGGRFFLQRAYGHRGFWRHGTRAVPAKMAECACRVRGGFRDRSGSSSASTLHDGCVCWNIRRIVGGERVRENF